MSEYNPFTLKGKTVLITGASSGIGRATAIECSQLGASVIITARNEGRLRDTYEQLRVEGEQLHQMYLADLSHDQELNDLIDSVPVVDGVSLNAGIVRTLPIKFIKEVDLMEVMATNTISSFNLVQRLLKKKKLSKQASVVFTSSIGGVFTVSMGNTMYSMSKGALNAFMKSFALEMASKGIRSNSVNPGMIDTNILSAGVISDEDLNKNRDLYPLGRHGKPNEVANAIVFLLSDASSFITGQTLIIDGGFTLR